MDPRQANGKKFKLEIQGEISNETNFAFLCPPCPHNAAAHNRCRRPIYHCFARFSSINNKSVCIAAHIHKHTQTHRTLGKALQIEPGSTSLRLVVFNFPRIMLPVALLHHILTAGWSEHFGLFHSNLPAPSSDPRSGTFYNFIHFLRYRSEGILL